LLSKAKSALTAKAYTDYTDMLTNQVNDIG